LVRDLNAVILLFSLIGGWPNSFGLNQKNQKFKAADILSQIHKLGCLGARKMSVNVGALFGLLERSAFLLVPAV